MKKMVFLLMFVLVLSSAAVFAGQFISPVTGEYVTDYNQTFVLSTTSLAPDNIPFAGVNIIVDVDGSAYEDSRVNYTYIFSPNDADGVPVASITNYRLTLPLAVVFGTDSNPAAGITFTTGWTVDYLEATNTYSFRKELGSVIDDTFALSFTSFYPPSVLTSTATATDNQLDKYGDQVQYVATVMTPNPGSDNPVVPEPSSIAFGAMGLVSLIGLKRKISRG